MYRFSRFSHFANGVARLIAHPVAFVGVLLLVLVWLITGPLFKFGSLWQAIFSSSTTVVTFLLLFLIQHTQAREMAAVQLKLNELIRSSEGAHNALLGIEQLTDRDYDLIKENYSLLAKQAREQIKDGHLKWATARVQMESLDSLLDPSASPHGAEVPVKATTPAVQAPAYDAIGTLDRLGRLAAKALGVPIIVISAAEQGNQWVVSDSGFSDTQTAERDALLGPQFAGAVVDSGKIVTCADVAHEPAFSLRDAAAALELAAYAGAAIVSPNGSVLGVFAAADRNPRTWSDDDLNTLSDCAAGAMNELAYHTRARGRSDAQQAEQSVRDAAGDATMSVTEGTGPGIEKGTILVVDDSATNRILLTRRLEGEGYVVATAAEGQEALTYVKGNTVALVLLDVMLPGMDGESVLAALQADDALKRIPVIMISALDEQESVKRCIELGARDYLMKPVDPVALTARIREHLPT